MTTQSYFVTAARGLSPLLALELEGLGCRVVRQEPGGCRVRGPLSLGYRICLWSRLANRVLMHVADLAVHDEDELYRGILGLAWEEHIGPEGTLAVDYVAQRAAVSHTHFGAQRTKDAIVDRIRERVGVRPSVDFEDPDVRVNVFARGAGCSVSIDLAGQSLHRRGWRAHAGLAPVKETTAASMLIHAGWREMATDGAAFVDPMAGAGTFVLEALTIAADIAPGLQRKRFGFHRWQGHDAELWGSILSEAQTRADAGLASLTSVFVAADAEASVVAIAEQNARAAGWADKISFEVRTLAAWTQAPASRGLLVTNPPYGHRLGGPVGARRTAGELGQCLSRVFGGWRASVLLGDERLVHVLGTAPTKVRPIDSGNLETVAVTMDLGSASPQAQLSQAFANRIKKNRRKLQAWFKRDSVTCYRIYDADIPEANVAVDRYEDWAHVQEYEAPATVDSQLAQARLQALVHALPEALGISPGQVVVKVRRRQRGSAQYDKQAELGVRFEVSEAGHRFWINLEDYLDTGLFLDHRPVRALVAALVAQRPRASFLNLFSYTSTATVYAIGAGAARTTSVDLSNTYLKWSRDNFSLAGVSATAHELIRDDVRRFLAKERREFDVILLDPPTFSTSKAMTGTLDILRDHPEFVRAAAARLAPGGVLVFSTNARRFKLDPDLASELAIEDISDATIPPDFARNRKIHRCFRIARK